MNLVSKVIKNKELRNKILFVLFVFVVFRVVSHIPIPGPDPKVVKEFLTDFFSKNALLGFLDIFSGGAMSRFSLGMLGVGPYITTAIIMELLVMVIPSLKELSKEGESGHQKINQYTRFISVPIAALQGFSMIKLIQKISARLGKDIIGNPTLAQWAIMIIAIVAGTVFLMWIGELISEKGIGNGISLLIFAGIIVRLPEAIGQSVSKAFAGTFDPQEILRLLAFAAFALFVIFVVVIVIEGHRKIPVSYAKRIRGMKMYGGVDTHLPFKVNQAGVIPIIFAGAFMNLPQMLSFFSGAKTKWVAQTANFIQNTFQADKWPYAVLFFLLVVSFTFFSTFMYFNPQDIAENLQKQGGFIPGVRPGKQTENYLTFILYRVTLWGSVFLGLIAILPFILIPITKTPNLTVGGTGLLIVVAVAIETVRQIEAQVLTRQYESY